MLVVVIVFVVSVQMGAEAQTTVVGRPTSWDVRNAMDMGYVFGCRQLASPSPCPSSSCSRTSSLPAWSSLEEPGLLALVVNRESPPRLGVTQPLWLLSGFGPQDGAGLSLGRLSYGMGRGSVPGCRELPPSSLLQLGTQYGLGVVPVT